VELNEAARANVEMKETELEGDHVERATLKGAQSQ
jgi:hypothetical protein